MPEDVAPITDPAALKSFLTAPPGDAMAVPQPMQGMMPQTVRALEAASGPLSEQAFIAREARPGVPLHLRPPEGEGEEINPWVRFQVERRQNLADQQKYLESVFGPGKVRKAEKTDDFIIRMPDPETGKEKDVVLNERDISIGDFAALTAHAPEIAASIGAMYLGGPLGVVLSRLGTAGKVAGYVAKSGLGRLALGATGTKVAQAGQQVETELEQGQTPDLAGIAKQKAKEIPGQFALDTAVAGVFKTASLGRRALAGGPGMFKSAAQEEGLPAAERLAAKYGQKTSYSAAEASGMPLIAFLEAYAAAKPQSRKAIEAFKDLQLQEQKALGEAMTAKAGTDEEAGAKLLAFLEKNQAAKQQALDAVRATMTEAEQRGLMKQLGKVARVSTPFLPSEAGGVVRSEFQKAYQGVKAKVADAYQRAYAVPGAMDPDVPTSTIASTIDSLKAAFPTAQGTGWLDTLKAELQPMERYKDIVQRRSDLWNKIQTAPADRSTKDYIFGQLSDAYTKLLDDAANNIKDFRFLTGIKAANAEYIKSELPFYQKGLADVLLKAGERGAPENIALLERFGESTDLYRRLVSVAGKDSPAVSQIKSSVIDGLLGKTGTNPINPQFVDAKAFGKELQNLAANPKTREMFNDIFGDRAKAIANEAKALSGIQGTLPKEEAEAYLRSGSVSSASKRNLRAVLREQEQLDSLEAHRALGRPIDEINPEEFVNRFADKLTESELKRVMADLQAHAPSLYAQMQDKTTEQILGKAGNYRTWSQSSLEGVLQDPQMLPKYRILLGDKFKDLEDFAKAMGPKQWAKVAAQGTGMLVKGESIGELSKLFALGGHKKANLVERAIGIVPGWMGWKYAAKGITSGAFREWAGKDFPGGVGLAVPAALVTEPILEDIATSGVAPSVVRNMVLAVRDYTQRNAQKSPEQPEQPSIKDRQELERFLMEK